MLVILLDDHSHGVGQRGPRGIDLNVGDEQVLSVGCDGALGNLEDAAEPTSILQAVQGERFGQENVPLIEAFTGSSLSNVR